MNPRKISGFLKLEHTLFSLPLLFAGAALAERHLGRGIGGLGWARALGLVLAGTGARTFALAFNRILDRFIDARNPRTKGRELPSGVLSLGQAWGVALAGLLLYIGSAWALGFWCLVLSPIPLAVFVAYPWMKRFTFLAHAGVGAGLGLSALGGFVGAANLPPLDPAVWWVALFTFFWVSGFDILYAIQDEAFDRREGLHSIPARFGPRSAALAGAVCHFSALACLLALPFGAFASHRPAAFAALVPVALLLGAEQQLGHSLEPQAAFFKVNAWVGVFVLLYVLAGTGNIF